MKKSLILVAVLGGLLALPALSLGFVLWKNDLPWSLPPGAQARLQRYLTHNRVETTEFPSYPELKSPEYTLEAAELFAVVLLAVKALGWQIQQTNKQYFTVEAVATTPILRFKDDLVVNVSSQDAGRSRLKITSRSRVGQADFGTNTRHILDLKAAVEAQLKKNQKK